MKSYKNFQKVVRPEYDSLNPFIFEKGVFRKELNEALFANAEEFVELIGFEPEMVESLVMVGHQANYNPCAEADCDISINIRRDLNLSKEEVLSANIRANQVNYVLSPSINGQIPICYYISHRNIGGIRPCDGGVYAPWVGTSG